MAKHAEPTMSAHWWSKIIPAPKPIRDTLDTHFAHITEVLPDTAHMKVQPWDYSQHSPSPTWA